MGVDTSTQPLTIYNILSSLPTSKIFFEGILLPTFDMNYHNRKIIKPLKFTHVTPSMQQTNKSYEHVNDLFKFKADKMMKESFMRHHSPCTANS